MDDSDSLWKKINQPPIALSVSLRQHCQHGLAAAVRDNLRAAASSAFEKMDLVSSEEFEVQKRVLLRTREKLEQLELQVAEVRKTDAVVIESEHTDSVCKSENGKAAN